MSKKDKLISVNHLKWNVGGIKCGTLTVDYLNWILDHEEPAVDAVPVRHAKLLNAHPYGECSNCGYLIDIREEFNYCPHCGARMDAK